MELSFERAAMKNEKIPPGLSPAQQSAFLSLRSLYQQYRKKQIDTKKAKDDKNEIIKALTLEKSQEDFLDRSALSLSQRISNASAQYRQSPSIENADKFYAAVYNLPDNFREKKQ